MAVTFEQLCAVLDQGEIKYQPHDDTTLLTVFQWEDERIDLVCSLWEEGELLDVRTANLAHLSREDPDRTARLLPRVSRINYDYKLARVAWEDDGQLTVGASLLLEDQPAVTFDQVAALISVVCRVGVDLRRSLRAAEAEAEAEGQDQPAPEAGPPPAAKVRMLSPLAELLMSAGVFFLGLAALIAALSVWLRP